MAEAIAARYRRLSDEFAAAVAAVPEDRWTSPSPCEGWTALDVVEHVANVQGMFLGFVGREAPTLPPVADDPLLALRGPFNIKLPFHHEHGRLELQPVDGNTRLVWTTRFHFSFPLIGGWIERKLGTSISASFVFFLKRLDGRLNNQQ